MEKEVKVTWREKPMINDYGTVYGRTYIVYGPPETPWNDLLEAFLDQKFDGVFPVSNDVWDQTEIVDGRRIKN